MEKTISFKHGRSRGGERLIICDNCFKRDKWAKKVPKRGNLCLKCRRSINLIIKN